MAHIDVEQFSGVVESIYAAAYGREPLQHVMARPAEIFDASRAYALQTTYDVDGRIERSPLAVMSVDDPGFGSAEAAVAFNACPTIGALLRVFAKQRPGSLVDIADYVDPREVHRTEVGQDWFRPRDMFHNIHGSIDDVGPDTRFVVGLCRSDRQEAFGWREKKLYSLFAPHFARAGEIQIALGEALQESAFDMLPAAVVLVDRNGRVRRLNARADALFRRADAVIHMRNGMLQAASPSDQAMLARLVASSFMPADVVMSPATMLLPREGRTGKAWDDRLVVSVGRPIDRVSALLEREPCAIVTIRPIRETTNDAFVSLVVRLFGLTCAQTNLAARLATGMSLKEAASANRISYKTARSYLEEIFHKTGTSRQSELVALLKTIDLLALPEPH